MGSSTARRKQIINTRVVAPKRPGEPAAGGRCFLLQPSGLWEGTLAGTSTAARNNKCGQVWRRTGPKSCREQSPLSLEPPKDSMLQKRKLIIGPARKSLSQPSALVTKAVADDFPGSSCHSTEKRGPAARRQPPPIPRPGQECCHPLLDSRGGSLCLLSQIPS